MLIVRIATTTPQIAVDVVRAVIQIAVVAEVVMMLIAIATTQANFWVFLYQTQLARVRIATQTDTQQTMWIVTNALMVVVILGYALPAI